MFRVTLSTSAIVHVLGAWYLCVQPDRIKEIAIDDPETVAFLRLTLKETVETESPNLFEESDVVEQIQPQSSFDKVAATVKQQDAAETTSVKPQEATKRVQTVAKPKPFEENVKSPETPGLVQVTPVKHNGTATTATTAKPKGPRSQAVGQTAITQSTKAAPRLTKKSKRALQMGYWKSLNAHFQSTSFEYPKRALLAGIEGKVYILIEVDQRGNIIAARINRSSGHQILDEAALKRVLATKRLPPLPSQLGNRNRKFRIPFEYRLPT